MNPSRKQYCHTLPCCELLQTTVITGLVRCVHRCSSSTVNSSWVTPSSPLSQENRHWSLKTKVTIWWKSICRGREFVPWASFKEKSRLEKSHQNTKGRGVLYKGPGRTACLLPSAFPAPFLSLLTHSHSLTCLLLFNKLSLFLTVCPQCNPSPGIRCRLNSAWASFSFSFLSLFL